MLPWSKSDRDVAFSIKQCRGSIGRAGRENECMKVQPSLYVYQPVLKIISRHIPINLWALSRVMLGYTVHAINMQYCMCCFWWYISYNSSHQMNDEIRWPCDGSDRGLDPRAAHKINVKSLANLKKNIHCSVLGDQEFCFWTWIFLPTIFGIWRNTANIICVLVSESIW